MFARMLPLARLAAILLVLSTTAARAEQVAVPQFQDGDSVCFIGDSITHGGLYHRNILLFYATRFPERHFQAYNCGISGDSAGGALNRYAWDIQPHRPTVATIMLGMNDVGRDSYGKDKTGAEIEKRRAGALAAYAANMDRLAKLLRQDHCRPIFITPSIYDQMGNQPTPCLFGVNDALGLCGRDGRELAARYQGSVVDFHGPMTEINARWQAKDPAFTIVGRDRVHPGEAGHLVMAYLLLKAQGVGACVSETVLDAAGPKIVRQANCTISGLKGDAGTLEFESLEKALPFPVPDAAAKALEIVPFQDDLNREMLVVTGLRPGRYEIVIDGQPVAAKSEAELAAGVNLAAIKTTPQQKQAQRVMTLNDKRHTIASSRLRTIAAVRHFVLNRAKPRPADAAAENRVLDAQLEKNRKANFAYGVMQIETYRKFRPDQERLEREAADAWKAMYVENKPAPHRFVIRPATGGQ